MKKTITAITAAAFLATGLTASVPAFAAAKKKTAEPAQPAMHPLPAIGVLPAMLILGTKENKKFKPHKPYGKNTRTSI